MSSLPTVTDTHMACVPLHLLHFVMERHSGLMWFFLKHTRHLPVLCFLSETSVTVLHVLEVCDWRQYEHLGTPDPLVRSELAVRGSLVVLLSPRQELPRALSLAIISASVTFNIASRVYSSSLTLRLMMSLNSSGNLFMKTNDNILP